jgi:hypothetical protein
MIAQGSWQKMVWQAMLDGGCRNPVSQLQGNASRYSVHYQHSFTNLLARAMRAGFTIDITPGPRGGRYSAVYVARMGD